MSFSYAGINGGGLGLVGCTVWYTYYETNSAEEADECRRLNPDVILTPDQVPLSKLDYTYLNEPTKAVIRQLFIITASAERDLHTRVFPAKRPDTIFASAAEPTIWTNLRI